MALPANEDEGDDLSEIIGFQILLLRWLQAIYALALPPSD